MVNGLGGAGSVNFLLVFVEGLLSFFSPCVIPLIPLYMSYLAGNAKQKNEDGTITYRRKKVFLHTVFFVLGVSFAFFILGLSFSALGAFFNHNKNVFSTIGGILIILLGLIQLGVFQMKFLQRERKVNLNLRGRSMNPFFAFLLGFTFSFAWTPCVGPMLSSVLIMASGAQNALLGNLLVLVYAMGFVIPFLLLGLFTAEMLNFLKKHQKALKYTVKAGGVLMIIMGIMVITGAMNGLTGFLSQFNPPGGGSASQSSSQQDENSSSEVSSSSSSSGEAPSSQEGSSAASQQEIPAFDFTLTDQYGKTHTLSEYKGKVVFLNFWATWCGPCQQEMPHIEALYKEMGRNEKDVVFLGVASPQNNKNPFAQDVPQPEIESFLKNNGYTFPVVFDQDGSVFESYFINSFPTTFMIGKDGNIFGYVQGTLTKAKMQNIIDQTLAGRK